MMIEHTKLKNAALICASISLMTVGALSAQAQNAPPSPAVKHSAASAPAIHTAPAHTVPHAASAALSSTEVIAAPLPVAFKPDSKPLTPLKVETNKYDFWQVDCDQFASPTLPVCRASLPVMNPNNATSVLLTMSVTKDAANDQWQLNINVPTSISVVTGVVLRFGDKRARKLSIVKCEPNSCTASTPLTPELKSELMGNDKANATWMHLSIGELRADFSLRGASMALAAVQK